MSETVFGSLEDVPLNTAWGHEAYDLTPWLSKNLDRLSDTIGFQLELVDTEVNVGRFSADILAREVGADRLVLIENQLYGSDHKHLGQIMTYLSGLDASVMIWIASSFREEHLSAIRWLNDHTIDPFAFFAIKLRTVRIGDSAIAPLLEVVEQPNDWEREAHRDARITDGERSALGKSRAERWAKFSERNPTFAIPDGYAASSYWLPTDNPAVFVTMFLGENRVGVFYRGPRSDEGAAREALRPHTDRLEAALGVPFRDKDGQYTLYHRRAIDGGDPDDRAAADDWLGERATAYVAAINTLDWSNDLDGEPE